MSRLFKFSAYPIWLKILLVLIVALFLLLIPAALLTRSVLADIALANAASFISQTGTEQTSVISGNIVQAQINLDAFAANPEYSRAMQSLLIGGARTQVSINLPDMRDDDMEALFSQVLLNPATTLFDTIRLVDRNGNVLADSALSTSLGVPSRNEADSPSFRAAEAAALAGDMRALSVSQIYNIGILEYSVAVQWRDGRVLGYLIGRISNPRAIYPGLQFPTGGFQGFSYLESAQGVIISPTETRFLIPGGAQNALVSAALSGVTGTQQFEIEGTPFIGFYTPVRGTPLALIAQLPTAEPLAAASDLFTTRNFVVLLGGLIIASIVAALAHLMIVPSMNRVRRATNAVIAGQLNTAIPDTNRGDELGRLAESVEAMRVSYEARVNTLESRVAARTRDIEATQDITRYAASERDVELMLNRVVDLIVERFDGIYHAQIFLLDADKANAVVRASTGEVGRQLLQRGHRLPVGSVSVIGQVTEQGRLILARDASTSQVHRRNEFLPETRAELAIPLKLGDEVIGALDVQSKQSDVFNEDLIAVLQSMAEQIAIAIQNARLYEENNRRAAELELINREATRRAWGEYMRDQRRDELEKSAGFVAVGEGDVQGLRARAVAERRVIFGEVTERNTIPLAVPIILRGQVMGAVEWEVPSEGFGQDKLDLAQELANRLAVSLENARLFAESRRATERERLVNNIAARLTTSASLDDILRTAVREVGQALGAPQVSIRLHSQTGAVKESNGAASAANKVDQPVTAPSSEVQSS